MTALHALLQMTFVFLLCTNVNCNLNELEDCLKIDSISCVQMQLYRNAKQLLNQQSIEVMDGITLIKDPKVTNRSSRSLELLEMEQHVENATDFISRQEAIENFLVRKVRDVVLEKTIRWDVGQSIRNILTSIPQAIKAKFTNYVTEARGKGKKFLRFLVPLLIGLKLKMAGMAALTYLGVAVLAKKALLASLISIIISGFIGLKKLISTKHGGYEDIAYHHHPVPSWAPSPVYDSHAADLTGQKIAYNSHLTS